MTKPSSSTAEQSKENAAEVLAQETAALFEAMRAEDFETARDVLLNSKHQALLARAVSHTRHLLLLKKQETVLQCASTHRGTVEFVEMITRLPFNLPVPAAGCAKLAWDAGNDELAQWFAKRETELRSAVSFFSLNVMLNNERRNLERINALILKREPDVVGLQEVTAQHLEVLRGHGLRAVYDFCADGPLESSHDTLLLVKKSLHARFETQRLAQNAARHVRFACFSACGKIWAVATFHLQSEFFTDAAERKKGAQLLAIGDRLRALGSDAIFCFGDSNLTGGGWLTPIANELVATAGFADAWLELHATDENQMSDDWKKLHATWSGWNPLVKHRHEFHRPDRCFVGAKVAAVHLEIVRGDGDANASDPTVLEPLSDHFGLAGTVRTLS